MEITLGSTVIGDGHPPAFLPDIDVYFRGDQERAFSLIDQLATQGAGIVKGALIHDPEIALASGGATEYFVAGQGQVSEGYRSIMERHAVPPDLLRRIYRRATERGMDIVLSVYDEPGVHLALEIGAVALKIPSSNIVHAPLIRRVAATGLPMLIDTGRSTIEEIDRAIAWARAAGATRLIVQHSPPGPPAPASEFHLRMMPALGRRHGCLYGLSDHFIGHEMMLVAVALGAHVVEKGLCADDADADIDIAHALRISDVRCVLEAIDTCWNALGADVRKMATDRPRPKDRMGLVARIGMTPGERLRLANVDFAFPTVGIPVEAWDEVEGRRLARPIEARQPIHWSDISDHG